MGNYVDPVYYIKVQITVILKSLALKLLSVCSNSSAYATTIFCVMEVAVCELITGQHIGIIYLLIIICG